MPGFMLWFFVAIFCYGACFLGWAGLQQRKRGKEKSAANFFKMAALLALAAISFLARELSR